MCIRDSAECAQVGDGAGVARDVREFVRDLFVRFHQRAKGCLLYTSDAADERSSVDLGGRRIIKKNKHIGSV